MGTYTQLLYQLVYSTKNRGNSLTPIHPSLSISNLVKDLKLSATDHIKQAGLFQNFTGWQNGYAAFTYHIDAKDNLIKYVLNQEIHHQKMNFIDELKELFKAQYIDFDEKYLL